MDWLAIGKEEDFIEDEPKAVYANGTAIAVFRLDEELFALHDLCTHGNAKLSDGYLEDGCIECPLHQGSFDIRTGAPRCSPVTEAVRSFPIRLVNGVVEVGLCGEKIEEAKPIEKFKGSVIAIEHPSEDVAVLKIECQQKLEYKAGQYLNVLLEDGAQRSYSLANRANSELIELHIRHMPGGKFTDYVFRKLKQGDVLNLEEPQGHFYLRETDVPIILLASGTGFAPIKAIVENAIANGNSRKMNLYWGGRRPQDIYMHDLCEQWVKEISWFKFIPVISNATTEDQWLGRQGFVHQTVLEDYPNLAHYEVYACGAPVMVEAAKKAFTEQCNLSENAFFADAFFSQADKLR